MHTLVDPNDPVIARYFQVSYLDWIMNRSYIKNAKTEKEKKHRAFLAYNWGHGNVSRYFEDNPNAVLGTEDEPGWGLIHL